MKFKVLVLLLFSFQWGFSQKFSLDYTPKTDSIYKKEKKDFIYLDEKLDLSSARYIGQIKSSGKLTSVLNSVYLIQQRGQKYGGNSFKFVSFKNENGLSELVLDIFIIDEKTKISNEELSPKNKIYFFGRDNDNKDADEFKLNDEVRSIKALHYYIYDFDAPVKINKGGLMGTTLFLNPQKKQSSHYINFSGFGLSGIAPVGMGLSFSAGKVMHMNKDFALLFTHIFNKQE